MKYPPKSIGLRHIDWVGLIVTTDLPSLSKLLAYQLSSYMNTSQDVAWPSQSRLMAETSMSKSTLNKHINLLESEGWIQRQSGNHSKTTRYTISFPKAIERTLENTNKVVRETNEGSIPNELGSTGDVLGVVRETDTNIQVNIQSNKQVKDKRFSPPSQKDIIEYSKFKKISINAEQFIDFYESKGWMVGKNKMKCWKAAVRNWSRRNKNEAHKQDTARNIGSFFDEQAESAIYELSKSAFPEI